MVKIEFGKEQEKRIIDENGSTSTTTTNYVAGLEKFPIRRSYEIRTRVLNQNEEHKAYMSFSDEINRDKSMLDPYFKIEHSLEGDKVGYYYATKCFTRLEK